jgi:membrane-bound ClpP family serine protease
MTHNEGSGTKTSYLIVIGCAALMLLFFAADLVVPLGYAVGVLYIMVILLSLQSPQSRFMLHIAAGSSILIVVGFLLSPGGGEVWKGIFNRGIALLAIWTTAVISYHRKVLEEKRERAVRDREKAMNELKVLRGLLPICASCKKIRNDQGYWTQMEAYIRDHSEANFSHSICPECAKRLYPEFHKDPDPGKDS